MGFLWGAKDELPAAGLVCVGKHLARVAACVAPRLLPVARRRANGTEPERHEPCGVAEIGADAGPLTGPELREATGLAEEGRRQGGRAACTTARAHELPPGRAGRAVGRARARPAGAQVAAAKTAAGSDDARRELARVVLEHAGELTAADLAGALGWRRKEAAAVLDEIADGRDAEGFRIWTRR